jgi:protein-disulfide isomerase
MANKKPGDNGLRNTVIGTIVFMVIALAGVVAYSNSAKNSSMPGGTSSKDGYGITFNSSATPQIDLWEDFQCPICHTFEGINGSYINELATSGKAKVIFHPMSFIGAESKIAANAAACANVDGKYVQFHTALYEDQASTENSGHWNSAAMIALGKKVGISSSAFADCVNNNKFDGWVTKVEDSASTKNVNATPTVFVNGKELNRQTQYMNADAFKAAITAAGAK